MIQIIASFLNWIHAQWTEVKVLKQFVDSLVFYTFLALIKQRFVFFEHTLCSLILFMISYWSLEFVHLFLSKCVLRYNYFRHLRMAMYQVILLMQNNYIFIYKRVKAIFIPHKLKCSLRSKSICVILKWYRFIKLMNS